MDRSNYTWPLLALCLLISGCAGPALWGDDREQKIASSLGYASPDTLPTDKDSPEKRPSHDDPMSNTAAEDSRSDRTKSSIAPKSIPKQPTRNTPPEASAAVRSVPAKRRAADSTDIPDASDVPTVDIDGAKTSPRENRRKQPQAVSDSDTVPDGTPSGGAATTADQMKLAMGLPSAGASRSPLQHDGELVAAVRALQIEDPQEEAQAIDALRTAPAAQRPLLLRTMQASLHGMRRVEQNRAQSPSIADTSNQDSVQSATYVEEESRAALQSNVEHDAKPARQTQPGRTNSSRSTDAAPTTAAEKRDGIPGSESAENEPSGTPRPAGSLANLPKAALGQEIRRNSDSSLPNGARPAAARAESASAFVDQGEEDWLLDLATAIAALEKRADNSAAPDAAALQTKLRLMYLLAGRRDDALRPIAALSPEQQDFWNKELYGLASYFNSEKQPLERRRATEAAMHLRDAAQRLAESGSLVVRNLHFCTEVKGYGIYSKFPKDEFKLGQEVLLYAEIENFKSRSTDKGFHTALKGTYQIFDQSGRRIAEKELAIKEEYCQNQRRDFFVPYFLWMPKLADDGVYTLKLTIEDVHRSEAAESTIEFSIKAK